MQGDRDIQRICRAMHGLFLVLRADPAFTVVAASDEYLHALHVEAAVLGRPLRELLPRTAQQEGPDAIEALQASLRRVQASGRAEAMPVLRFGAHHWQPLNTPVLGDDGAVDYIVHRAHPGPAEVHEDAAGLLDSITEGFYTLDREWRFGHVNREALRILDRRPGELPGRVVWEAYPGLEGTEIERRFQRAMHERETGSFTAWYELHQRWYEITVYPAPEGISVFFRDVTAQRALQAQRDALLAESERQRRIYETALDSTPDFVSVYDLEHRLIYANAALLKAWGVADARGRRLRELGYERWQADLHDREITQVIATGTALRGEIPFAGTAGRRLYDYIFAPVLGADGEVVAVACTARDITERNQIAERLGENQRLEAIGTLAGGVAHDFNNMLAAILANLALAEQEVAHASATRSRLALAHRAAERARSLVRQILTFSRRAPKLPQVQLLQPLIDEAIDLLRSTLPPTVNLVVRAAPEPAWASVDAAQWQQTVVNLCTNAWQALPDERGTVRVSLATVWLSPLQADRLQLSAGDYLRLRVADNGAGMDEAVRARIFEPFFTTKTDGRGTGLGLAVVHGVVRESGGAVRVSSRPGRGTAVDVYLPSQLPPGPDVRPPAPRAPPAVAGAAARILYVDDDEIVALTAQALLSQAGFDVRCVRDGPAALAALREADAGFAAVVTDFNMPDMSGLALAEAIAREAPDLPVIVISGLVTDELQLAAERLGVRRVVFKENMLELLPDAVRAVLPAA